MTQLYRTLESGEDSVTGDRFLDTHTRLRPITPDEIREVIQAKTLADHCCERATKAEAACAAKQKRIEELEAQIANS
jgi:hypothetical protein